MGTFLRRLLLILLFSWAAAAAAETAGQPPPPPLPFSIVSAFSLPDTWLRPYDWTYLRVELPLWFSSMTMTFMSDVDIDKDRIKKLPSSRLPLMCLKNGSPPLPDVSEDSLSNLLVNGTFVAMQNLRNMEQCIPFQENLTVTLTSEQISPGIWYLGFFNGLGPVRTQSKMISRGQGHMFRTNIKVEGCATPSLGGPYCNRTIDTVSCSQSSLYIHSRILLDLQEYMRSSLNHPIKSRGHWGNNYYLLSENNHIKENKVESNPTTPAAVENLITCNNSYESSCLGYGELKFYFLDIVSISSQFKVSVTDFRLNQTTSGDNLADFSAIHLMCYARYNAMPLETTYDYAADIRKEPLTVKSPRSGRWYIAVQVVNQTTVNKVMQEKSAEANMCFSFGWEVHECLNGKVGLNCTWEMYMLQRVPKSSSGIPFESYYVPVAESGSIEPDFPLEYLLSNSSVDNNTWTYFFMDIPDGAAGANVHIQLISDSEVEYEVYLKHGGLAYIDTWDFYLNKSGSNNGSMFLALVDPKKDRADIYILYAREGTWCFGLKHPPDALNKHQTTMSISLEGCPRHCSYNGECHYSIDHSGLTFYSYCSCDRDHGGFDCSNELVSPEGHIWQSVFLIASNAAAILPAFWALRQKAFSEWVLFTSSGISSGLYHACDVGTWCPLSFHVLQFMDFWLSFMAVVSTFIYMTTINDASKRAIHTSVAILTALLAVSGATRSANIVLVIAIGTLGLLIGWLLEFCTANRSPYCPALFELLVNERWENIKQWFLNIFKSLHKRFHWRFLLLGFIGLALAGTSWKLETNESYWIWHSCWHITIYISSFFFLCSTSVNGNTEGQEAEYELTRQNSTSRSE